MEKTRSGKIQSIQGRVWDWDKVIGDRVRVEKRL
jgi:hypothetical protein